MKEVFAVNSKTADSFLLFLSVIYRLIQRILPINKIILISRIPLFYWGRFFQQYASHTMAAQTRSASTLRFD